MSIVKRRHCRVLPDTAKRQKPKFRKWFANVKKPLERVEAERCAHDGTCIGDRCVTDQTTCKSSCRCGDSCERWQGQFIAEGILTKAFEGGELLYLVKWKDFPEEEYAVILAYLASYVTDGGTGRLGSLLRVSSILTASSNYGNSVTRSSMLRHGRSGSTPTRKSKLCVKRKCGRKSKTQETSRIDTIQSLHIAKVDLRITTHKGPSQTRMRGSSWAIKMTTIRSVGIKFREIRSTKMVKSEIAIQ